MCACDTAPGFVCSQCKGTPFDPAYHDDDLDRVTPMEFDALASMHTSDGDWPERFWI